MSAFDAYALDESGLAIRQEVGVRLRDFLERKTRSITRERTRRAVESALRAVERAVANGLSLDALRGKILAVRAWLSRQRDEAIDVDDEVAGEADAELLLLFERIRAADRRTTIENWSAYVVTVDVSF